MSKHITIAILAILLVGIALPQIVLAKGLVPCGGHGEPRCNICHIFQMLQGIIKVSAISIFGLAGLFILIGGIVLLTSAGSPETSSQGKRIITYAIIGIVVALGAWLVINTVMNELVNPQAMPWPWNKITCVPTEPIEGNNKICCYDLEGDSYACHTYKSESECKAPEGCEADASSAGAFRWCCVDTQRRCSSTPDPVGEKKYCVCEVPVYDLDPNTYPGQASIIGTNIKVSQLDSKETCQQECISGNTGTYCPPTLKLDQAKLYCTNESSVKSKRTCGVKFTTQETSIDCQISSECFATDLDCIAVVTPTLPAFNKNYAQKCFVNGEDLCNYRILKGGDSYCPNKYPSPCTSADRKFALYRWRSEISMFEKNAYDCSRNAYGNTDIVCRLDCQYDKTCRKPETNWCNDVKGSFSCFGSFTCKNIIPSQEANASTELKNLLSCMGGKLPNGAKIITSISDNSKGKCFELSYWDEKGKCSGSTDSCTGTCCGHSRSSLHYGGIAGTVDCRKYSWAVDFSRDTIGYKTEIEGVVKDCLKEMYKEMKDLQEFHLLNEGDHLHLQLTGVSKYHRCGTAGL